MNNLTPAKILALIALILAVASFLVTGLPLVTVAVLLLAIAILIA